MVESQVLSPVLLLALLAACAAPPPHPANPEDLRRILEVEAGRKDPVSELQGFLASPAPRVRRQAVRALGRSRVPEARFAVSLRLQDPDREVRRTALGALFWLGPEAAALAMPALVDDSDTELQALAATVAGEGDRAEAIPALCALLENGEKAGREAAAASLGRLLPRLAAKGLAPQELTRSLDCLLTAAEFEADAEVRWRAVWALSRLAGPPTAEALERRARSDADWRVRLFALRGLSRLGGSPETAAALARAAGDMEPQVAQEALGLLAAPRADAQAPPSGPPLRPALLGALASPCPHLRFLALAGLAREGVGPEGLAPFFRGRADEEAWVQGGAVASLAEVAGEAYGPLLRLEAAAGSWQIRGSAARAAARVGVEIGRQVLPGLARDPDERVRLEAVHGLASLSREAWARSLAGTLLADPCPYVAAAAGELLASRPDPELLPVVTAAWPRQAGPERFLVRAALVGALAATPGAAGAPEAAAILALAREDAMAAVRARAGAPPTLPATAEKALCPVPPAGAIPPAGTRLELETDHGLVVVELDVDSAPLHAALWARLAREGALAGRRVHQVEPGLGVRAFGGRATGPAGADREGRLMAQEPTLAPVGPGSVLALELAGPDTGGDGLLFCLVPCPHLEGRASLVGRVVAGLAAVAALQPGDGLRKAVLRLP